MTLPKEDRRVFVDSIIADVESGNEEIVCKLFPSSIKWRLETGDLWKLFHFLSERLALRNKESGNGNYRSKIRNDGLLKAYASVAIMERWSFWQEHLENNSHFCFTPEKGEIIVKFPNVGEVVIMERIMTHLAFRHMMCYAHAFTKKIASIKEVA